MVDGVKLTCRICGKDFERSKKLYKHDSDPVCKSCRVSLGKKNRSPEEKVKIAEKQRATFKAKYGVDTPLQLKRVRDSIDYHSEERKLKTEQTNLERYGVKNTFQSKNSLDAIEKKYGSKYAAQNKEVIEKQKATNLERYGAECFLSTEDFKKKSKETKAEKYGSETFNNREKARETMLEKYGYVNVTCVPEVKEMKTQLRI